MSDFLKKGYWLKRLFDILFSFVLLIVTSPIAIASIVVIRIMSPEAPAIFKQMRIGYRMKPFKILKLRTMTNERDANGELLSDELRTKRWGNIIRSMNLDELPQMINILKGDMSLIGPRPLLPEQMGVMTDMEQQRRQMLLPGISGWEAVNEAKAPTREEKAKFDLYYVNNWSIWLDFRIFLKTIVIILLKLRPDDSVRAPKMPIPPHIEEKYEAGNLDIS